MTLNYETREKAPAHVHLESVNHVHTLSFPLSSAWLIHFIIGSNFVLAAIQLILIGVAIRLNNQFLPFTQSPWNILITALLAMPLFYAVIACIMIRSYRRHGQIPRSTWIDTNTQTLGHRQERNARHRLWPLQKLTHLRVSNIPNLAGIPLGHIVEIRIQGRLSPLTFRCLTEHQNTLHAFLALLLPLIPKAKVKLPREVKSLR